MTLSTTQMQDMAAKWQRPKASPMYAFSVFLVAGVVVLLPVIYLALIAAAGYGMVRYCTDVIPGLTDTVTDSHSLHGTGRSQAFLLLLALAPAIIGVAIVLFMLKPLFAPRRQREDTVPVRRNEESRLYQFVEGVCYVIGAPMPARIDVTYAPNASASFRGGLLSLFRRGDLVLTIGMPLVMGMTSGQLAGVIAHELGHFAQGAAMRAYYLTTIVEMWLARAAYERDGWDAWIDEQLRQSPHWIASIILLSIKCGIFLTRLVLRVLLYVGELICMHMSRQMEFNADRFEIQFSGSEAFAHVCERIDSLCAGFPRAERIAADMWRAGKQLPDDMPSLIADASLRITPEERARIERARRTERAWLFLSHPPTRVRLARAREAAEPGIYHNTEPAATLCTDASIYCKRVTYGLFRERVGGWVNEATFVPTATILAPRAADHARRGAAEKYFGFEPPTWRPVLLSMRCLPDVVDLRGTVEKLKQAIAAVRASGPAADRAAKVFREATEKKDRCEQAAAVMDAHLIVDYHRLELPKSSRATLSRMAWDAQNQAASATSEIDAGLDAACVRLATALSLLAAPGIEKYVDRLDERRKRANELLPVMASLKSVFSVAGEIRESMGMARELIGAIRSEDTFKAAREKLRPLSDSVRSNVLHARQECGGVIYPHRPGPDNASRESWEAPSIAGVATNLGERLAPQSPGHRQYDDIFSAGALFTDRFVEELGRTTGELVEIAAAIEDALRKATASKKPQPTS